MSAEPREAAGPVPLKIFYSYAHEDEALREKLQNHMKVLKRNGYISEWHDRKISAGEDWDGQISDNLMDADIILLLISDDFLGSDYCYEIEMKRALERHNNPSDHARVVPIILRDCDWTSGAFSQLQALPKEGKAVTGRHWHNEDEAFTDVARGIRKIVGEISQLT